MWVGLVGAVLLVLALLFVFAPSVLPEFLRPMGGAASAIEHSPDGRIAFMRTSEDGKQRDLYVVNPDGSRQERITSGILVEGGLAWSPDGRYLLAQASIEGATRIVRLAIGADNKAAESVQLTADIQADSVLPAWSPDGTLIAFQSKKDGGDYQVFVMDRDGNNKRRLSDGRGYAGWPAWSPDGKSVVYVQGDKPDPGTAKEIYVAPLEGGAPRQVTSFGKDLIRPQWSPDGKHLLYVEGRGDRSAIMLMNADGTGSHEIALASRGTSPQLSPDGSRVAYYAVNPPQPGSDIFVVPIGGGTPTNLTAASADDYAPAWSPDGNRLTWASSRAGAFRIVVARTDGADVRVVSSGSGSDSQPAWGPPVNE
jgi:Tol biopolymer transport system component